jgi:hypothetical protein
MFEMSDGWLHFEVAIISTGECTGECSVRSRGVDFPHRRMRAAPDFQLSCRRCKGNRRRICSGYIFASLVKPAHVLVQHRNIPIPVETAIPDVGCQGLMDLLAR